MYYFLSHHPNPAPAYGRPYELNYARADIKGGMLNLLKTLTCAADFIKSIANQVFLYMRALRSCAVNLRPLSIGPVHRAAVLEPASACRSQNVCRPVRPTAESCAQFEQRQNPVPEPTQPMAGEFSRGHRGADPGTAPPVLERFPPPPTGLD